MSEERSHFFMLPNLIDDLGLDVYQFRVYSAICRAAGADGQCTKSVPKLAVQCGISERKLITTLHELCITNPIVHKSLIKIIRRKTQYGDSDTNIIVVNSLWEDNSKIFKESSGGARHAPGGAQDAGGVVHAMHQGGAHGAPKEYTIKNIPIKKTTTTPPPSYAVHKSQSSFSDENKRQAATALKDWLDCQAPIMRDRRIGTRKTKIHIEKVQWGNDWIIPLKTIERLINSYGIGFVTDQASEMVKQQKDLDQGKGKGIDKPETWLKLACENNWANSEKKG